MADWETALKITLTETGQEIVIPYEAGRGITQNYSMLDEAAETRRSVNGTLIVVARPLFRKYTTEISCSDYSTPALAAVSKGSKVTVDCVTPFREPVSGGAITVARTPVSGSVVCYDANGDIVEHTRSGRSVTCAGAVLVEYRPRLICNVSDVSWNGAEIAFESNSWSLSLEEY